MGWPVSACRPWQKLFNKHKDFQWAVKADAAFAGLPDGLSSAVGFGFISRQPFERVCGALRVQTLTDSVQIVAVSLYLVPYAGVTCRTPAKLYMMPCAGLQAKVEAVLPRPGLEPGSFG